VTRKNGMQTTPHKIYSNRENNWQNKIKT